MAQLLAGNQSAQVCSAARLSVDPSSDACKMPNLSALPYGCHPLQAISCLIGISPTPPSLKSLFTACCNSTNIFTTGKKKKHQAHPPTQISPQGTHCAPSLHQLGCRCQKTFLGSNITLHSEFSPWLCKHPRGCPRPRRYLGIGTTGDTGRMGPP